VVIPAKSAAFQDSIIEETPKTHVSKHSCHSSVLYDDILTTRLEFDIYGFDLD
jgi:hypothetical protein